LGLRLHRIYLDGLRFAVEVSGKRHELIRFAQLLAWLSAVFRNPNYGTISWSKVNIQKKAATGNDDDDDNDVAAAERVPQRAVFDIDLMALTGINFDERFSCWQLIFNNTVIAADFPVPERTNEVGLELPFQAMLTLSRVSYSLQTPKAVVFKGYSTALVPQGQPNPESIPESIQWHFIQSSTSKEKLDVIEVYQHIPEDLKDLTVERLSNARTFLAYDANVCVQLGTKDSGYKQAVLSGVEKDLSISSVEKGPAACFTGREKILFST